VGILVSVGMITLMERKILALTQRRLSVNKTIFGALFQPFLDGFKLMLKQLSLNKKGFVFFMVLAPILMFIFGFLFWDLINLEYLESFHYNVLLFICFLRTSVFAILISAVGSFNKYSFLGAVRSLIQTTCCEIVMSLLLYMVMFLSISFDFLVLNMLYNFWILMLWFICVLLETMRSPFDTGERESELVSAFNLEYRGSLFILIFLSEYSGIIFFS